MILATTDGGATWEEQYQEDLPDGGIGGLQFIDERTGWAIMSDSRAGSAAKRTLLATTNAGATWTELGELENFSGPRFVSETVGWGRTWASAGADLVHTTDGGLTWQIVPTEEDIGSVCFADEKRGWTATDVGSVLQTTDGGLTWDTVFTPDIDPFERSSEGVACLDSTVWAWFNYGQARGTHQLFVSSDGGASWADVPQINAQGTTLTRRIGLGGGISFADANTFYIGRRCGPCSPSHYYITRLDNTGATLMSQVAVPNVDSFTSCSFTSTSTGWITGRSFNPDDLADRTHDPMLLKTSDGGATWQNLTLTFR